VKVLQTPRGSDLNRREQLREHRRRGRTGTAVVGKVSCLDQRLGDAGLEMPVGD
jgi:hypothetical protein